MKKFFNVLIYIFFGLFIIIYYALKELAKPQK